MDYNLRSNTSKKIGNLETVYYGTEPLTNLEAKIWNLLPNEYEELKSFPCLSQKFQIELQMNALVECTKTMLQTLVPSDR